MVATARSQTLKVVDGAGEIIADLDEIQGTWTTEQYLRLTNHTNKMIEFTAGNLEVLSMPTDHHQAIVQFLLYALHSLLQSRGGIVRVAPLRLRVYEDRFREPDLLVLFDSRDTRRQNAYWLGADLVIEVVSPDNPERDITEKRRDYAKALIPEYWIVNPTTETCAILSLADGVYAEHGVYRRGDMATSVLLDGFSVGIGEVLDAE